MVRAKSCSNSIFLNSVLKLISLKYKSREYSLAKVNTMNKPTFRRAPQTNYSALIRGALHAQGVKEALTTEKKKALLKEHGQLIDATIARKVPTTKRAAEMKLLQLRAKQNVLQKESTVGEIKKGVSAIEYFEFVSDELRNSKSIFEAARKLDRFSHNLQLKHMEVLKSLAKKDSRIKHATENLLEYLLIPSDPRTLDSFRNGQIPSEIRKTVGRMEKMQGRDIHTYINDSGVRSRFVFTIDALKQVLGTRRKLIAEAKNAISEIYASENSAVSSELKAIEDERKIIKQNTERAITPEKIANMYSFYKERK